MEVQKQKRELCVTIIQVFNKHSSENRFKSCALVPQANKILEYILDCWFWNIYHEQNTFSETREQTNPSHATNCRWYQCMCSAVHHSDHTAINYINMVTQTWHLVGPLLIKLLVVNCSSWKTESQKTSGWKTLQATSSVRSSIEILRRSNQAML